MTIPTGIPGADELVGKGVYRGMPENVPQPVRNSHAVIEYLEALVLRRIDSGRIEACNASALFIF